MTNIRGCREETVEGETGFLVPVHDSVALAERLLEEEAGLIPAEIKEIGTALLLAVLAVPACLYGAFILMIVIAQPRWN